MGRGEEGSQNDADATDHHVSDSEEGVLATHNGAGRDENGLGTTVSGDIEICSSVSAVF